MTRFSLYGLLNQTAYVLHRHYFFGWTLTRWLIIGLFAPSVLGVLNILPISRPIVIIPLVIGLAVILTLWRIKSSGYLHFTPTNLTLPTPTPLPDTAEISIRVSGNFSIRTTTRYFVEANAHYQTFQTRERVLKVNIPFTRFLLLSHSPEPETGWWYAFFTPETLKTYRAGILHFGLVPHPALHLIYQADEADKPEHLFISFDSAESSAKIIADLLADGL